MNEKYRQLLSDTLIWLQENPQICLTQEEAYLKLYHKINTQPSGVALIFYSQEEALFYEKLKTAIERHLSPAYLVDAADWSQEKKKRTPQWILATQPLSEEEIPLIQLSLPSVYETDLQAKKALWKLLCQKLTSPQSS